MLGRFEWLLAAPWRLPLLVALLIALPVIAQGELAATDARVRAHDEQLASVARVAQQAATGLNDSIARVRAQVAAVASPATLAVPGLRRFPLIDALRAGDGAGVDAQLSVVQTLIQSGPPGMDPGSAYHNFQPAQYVGIVDANGVVAYDNGSGSVGTSVAEPVLVGGSTAHPELARPLWTDLTRATRATPTSVSQPLFQSGPRDFMYRFAPSSTQVGLFVAGYIDRARGDAPAYLVIFLDIRPFADQYLQPLLGSVDEVDVVDASGLTLVRCLSALLCGAAPFAHDVSGDPIVARALSVTSVSQEGIDTLFGAAPNFIASAALPDTGWRAIAVRSTGAIEAALNADLAEQRTVRGLLVVLLLGATYLLARSASQVSLQRRALTESLEQQTAVSEVLAAIGRSGFDPQPVFDLALASAGRLCRADGGGLYLRDGDLFRFRANWSDDEERFEAHTEYAREHPLLLTNPGVTGRVYRAGAAVQIPDLEIEPDIPQEPLQYLRGLVRTVLGVPLLKDGSVIGVISLVHRTVTPFSDHDIALVRTFADQAVLALENARLLNETKEALERQTATAEVLQVMSRSAFDLQQVLDTVVESATKLCGAEWGFFWRLEASVYRVAAGWGRWNSEVLAQARGQAIRIGDADNVMTRAAIACQPVQSDVAVDPAYADRPEGQHGRMRLGVPVLREGLCIGVVVLFREAPKAFTPGEIALVQTFADQAVIAIENVRLITEIQEKSRELEIASKHKSEFLANMSHELRTPLNAIIGFADVLGQNMFGALNPKQADYLADIGSSGRHLLDLVNQILDLSKVEAGRMELEPSAFAPGETIRASLAFVRERAAAHAIELAADVPADLPTVTADERKIRQVLLNLLSNAVKFTPDGGSIGVSVRVSGRELEVTVKDTGIGIPADDLPLVFEEFRQVGQRSDRSREGTGLGLTLARKFVELHGGRMWVESAVGKGSTFGFAIPVDRPVAVPA